MMFVDRVDAGRQLAARLRDNPPDNATVLALPRGGVPVAREVARALGTPLDVLIVRKLGVPWHPEYGFGALGEGDVMVVDERIVHELQIEPEAVSQVITAETAEIERRVQQYRAGRAPESVVDRTAVLVDDGLATGSTMAAAARVVRELGAARVMVAVPVASQDAVRWIGSLVDDIVCLSTPVEFRAVGQYYADFRQLSDADVMATLADYRAERTERRRGYAALPETESDRPVDSGGVDTDVSIPADGVFLPGHLTVPAHAHGVVVFAHGSGSSRNSPRNQYVASVLTEAGLGTLLFDLLTPEEAADRSNVFDIGLLATRLVHTVEWLIDQPAAATKAVGLFGASTGGAAALVAAARLPNVVASVVSRGGRPDLAGPALTRVRAPTLLIVGDRDHLVIELNRAAGRQLAGPNQLVLVPGASHLFEEPGTLNEAADLAKRHFLATL